MVDFHIIDAGHFVQDHVQHKTLTVAALNSSFLIIMSNSSAEILVHVHVLWPRIMCNGMV
jgi:hypothetical protein